METYTRDGKVIQAWSEMQCNNLEIHPAHKWNAPYLVYGPYLCNGVPDPGLEAGLI